MCMVACQMGRVTGGGGGWPIKQEGLWLDLGGVEACGNRI